MFLLFIQDSIAQLLEPISVEPTNLLSTVIKDSMIIDSVLDEPIELIRSIAENTNPNPYTVLGVVVGIISAIFAYIGARYSYLTATSVKRVNEKTQENLLIDLIRHLYRNEICTLAFVAKWKKNPRQYPADEHLLKLQTLPEDIHMERYNSQPQHYEKMHELGMLLRNYNTEIEVARMHISNPGMPRKVIERDMDTLIFKPIYLINRICDVIEVILNKKSTKERANILILTEHFKKLKDNYNGNVWTFKGKVNVMLDSKTESWIEKLIVKETDENNNKNEKKELQDIYDACLNIANHSKSEFTEKDLKRLNLLSEKEESRKKRKGALEEMEKNELTELQRNNLKAVILGETKCSLPEDLQWNNLKIMLEAIKTDVTIEYKKIGMIQYPTKVEDNLTPKNK